MSSTCSNPPSSPSSDEFLIMKPTLHGPDQAVQGYHIKQPITLDDNQVYHFKEYVRGSFHDRNGELMCYAHFKCIKVATSSQHHPSTLIVPIHLRVTTGVCSRFGCALKRGIMGCLGDTYACQDDKHWEGGDVRICFLSLLLPDYVISAGPRAKGCDQCSGSSSAWSLRIPTAPGKFHVPIALLDL